MKNPCDVWPILYKSLSDDEMPGSSHGRANPDYRQNRFLKFFSGTGSKMTGKTFSAWVKIKEGYMLTEHEVRDFCKGKIAHFKTPRYVMFVNDFPMGVTGRIQKFRMREDSIRILGLHEEGKIETAWFFGMKWSFHLS